LIVRPVPARARKLDAIYRSKSQALAQVLSAYNEREVKLILDFFSRVNSESAEAEP
jgi:hypothetical protein